MTKMRTYLGKIDLKKNGNSIILGYDNGGICYLYGYNLAHYFDLGVVILNPELTASFPFSFKSHDISTIFSELKKICEEYKYYLFEITKDFYNVTLLKESDFIEL